MSLVQRLGMRLGMVKPKVPSTVGTTGKLSRPLAMDVNKIERELLEARRVILIGTAVITIPSVFYLILSFHAYGKWLGFDREIDFQRKLKAGLFMGLRRDGKFRAYLEFDEDDDEEEDEDDDE